MSTKRLKIAILWHMHQPDYRDPTNGRTLLPWTWLHAVKDYGEMLETVAECQAPVTINLVPTLLEQLDRYRRGVDADSWLELARKDAAELALPERIFLLEQFFSVNDQRHLLPHPRYRQLRQKRGRDPVASAPDFSAQELRDLQVWFLLSWTGYHLRKREPLIGQLLRRGDMFTEAEKADVFNICNAEVTRIIDRHAELEAAGLIEISLTPYAHPILPLLCELRRASEPSPGISLPLADFHYPEDARLQIREGVRTGNQLLGERTRGIWPAEGAVSEDAIRLLAEEKVLWAASDEGILARSLPNGLTDRRALYQVYSYAGLPLVFRDREISDKIGFLYADWPAKEAVADIIRQLKAIKNTVPEGLVPIILDGENCWERYVDNGYPFLQQLYRALLDDPAFDLCTIGQAVADSQPQPLEKLAAGSWIRSDFTTWIGHPEENRGWELLATARHACLTDQVARALKTPELPINEQLRELLRAEGSDWFWWFGDEHQTTQANIFDRLFRSHLEGLYHLSGLPTPPNLQHPIKPPRAQIRSCEPAERFTPRIDGQVGDYFEWLAAGEIDLAAAGAMHAIQQGPSRLFYGYDETSLYLRVDEVKLLKQLCTEWGYFEIHLHGRRNLCLRWQPQKNLLELFSQEEKLGEGRAVAGNILELEIPLKLLVLTPNDELRLFCCCVQQGRSAGRWPGEGDAPLIYRGALLDEENWII
ncbi:glycoside hydrolase family 57 protein [Geopsychrobacter electrodiphilus]|uniref:glycoside hydrolase family 57 protein n=1 Tax=Geopsychrobacter electrodiphilus TaxID=225196 RepID=UPI0003645358|nr:glycoside hydrolase family 57 protein [Geopsychrobacter electrodiphilus]